ncbi:hypothetical protein IFM89_016444 [Coptis chinensis]|uniref:Uncharacterized protein n=1 Tax=Coptis chinensis TaxID=261450 RepID=A0A835LDU8_9MAGN|nr:hypothetical protein IFM89_016444 [Coptis chinensis]
MLGRRLFYIISSATFHKDRVELVCLTHWFATSRKLIGARYFNKGYIAGGGHPSFESARDSDGHGTHTLSTAGGNFVPGANVLGFGNGTAKGGSPRSRVAAYKICWPPINDNECFDADIMAAFDAAIHDGVDVLSVSLGGDPIGYLKDGLSIGSFHAHKKGIVVVSSAGNSGPKDGSVSNLSPWMVTVGASTMDREFPAYVALGNKRRFKGESLSGKRLPAGKFYPLINSVDAKTPNASALDAQLCKSGSLDPKKVKNKILVCLRGVTGRVDKGIQAALAGAVGMVLANDVTTGNEVIADAHVLLTSHISYTDGLAVFKYINSTKSPVAHITTPRTKLDTKPAPVMASFSSKGPNTITPEILKPDITAPGVSIIAAYTQATGPTGQSDDKRRVLFNSESGTSMSCPHISGIVGLIKTLHPDWSPSAIKSAIMTTGETRYFISFSLPVIDVSIRCPDLVCSFSYLARVRDNVFEPMLNASDQKATPFSYGAGHVRPNRAMDPGLVYDLILNDYLNFLCSLGYKEEQVKLFSDEPYSCPKSYSVLNFNYPSITVPSLSGSINVTRTVKNVGSPGTYKALIRQPKGISISVEPHLLKFSNVWEEQTFKVTFKVKKAVSSDYVFGMLTWTDGKHYVKSPIVVKADRR